MANPAEPLRYGQLGAGGRVHVESDGVHVTDEAGTGRVQIGRLPSGDYGLQVVNAGATVIVDGTSNMMKIAATGTVSNTIAAGSADGTGTTISTWTDVNLALGLSSDQAVLGFIGTAATAGSPRVLGRLNTWAPGVDNGLVAYVTMDVAGMLSGSDTVVRFGGHNRRNIAQTWYCRYYVMKEAAL